MSKHYSVTARKKLIEALQAATDPMLIVELGNTLAKYLPRPKSARRKRAPVSPITPKELTINEMIVASEKHKQGLPLTEEEQLFIAAMEKKRREAGNGSGQAVKGQL